MPESTIFVTGATGRTGGFAVEYLRKSGAAVVLGRAHFSEEADWCDVGVS
jgi:NADPH:quinone reductase-like Zn-dependent oxidoreductase